MIRKRAIKKCRGTLKAAGYGCGNIKTMHKYGLCKDCFKDWFDNSEEGKKYFNKSISIGKKRAEKQIKTENRRKKIESKSIDQLKQEARRPFQKLIRIRDHGKKCICCNRPLPFNIGDYDAGHCYKAEMYSGLIYHPDNVHGQLVYCNQHSHGNESSYVEVLENRIGIERFNKLTKLKNKVKDYKWSRQELIDLKKYYNKELRDVEKGFKDIKEVDLNIGIING